MDNMKKNHWQTNGFSLFELMVALSILAMLFSVTAVIFKAGIKTYEFHDDGLFPFKEARYLFTAIEDDFADMIASEQNDGPAQFSECLNGSATTLRFVRLNDDKQYTEVRYVYNNTAQTFERNEISLNTAVLSDPPTSPDTPTVILASRVTACSFSYLSGVANGIQMTTQYTAWPVNGVLPEDSPSEMPAAILVTVTITDTKNPDIQESFGRLYAVRSR